MPAEIVVMKDCASNYGVFRVQGSSKVYRIAFHGSEQEPSHFDCPGFKNRRDCKHVREIWDRACLYNPQWRDGNPDPGLIPETYTVLDFTGTPCPACGGPTVYVRRAV
jgi:hypothetical protein